MSLKKNLTYLWQKRFVVSAILLPVALFFGAWAFWYEPSSLTVKNYELKISGWNPSQNNFKIVAISDVHGGSNFVDEAKIQKVVELANQQNADLIVLLGDFVSQKFLKREELKMPMPLIADNLRGLRAKYGVFGVLGNHDAEYGDAKVRAELERVGIRVLENEAVVIEHNGENLILLGLPDILKVTSGWFNYAINGHEALQKTGANGNIIAITHNPDAFAYVAHDLLIDPNFRLMLSGHTHGGQVRFPIFGSLVVPSTWGQRYARGHVVENGRSLFVTPGIGTSIMPVRFRVPPEISVLTISAD
jgi:predicted MPP superfamily phosphohydrolase